MEGAPPYAGVWPALSGHHILTSLNASSYPVRDLCYKPPIHLHTLINPHYSTYKQVRIHRHLPLFRQSSYNHRLLRCLTEIRECSYSRHSSHLRWSTYIAYYLKLNKTVIAATFEVVSNSKSSSFSFWWYLSWTYLWTVAFYRKVRKMKNE